MAPCARVGNGRWTALLQAPAGEFPTRCSLLTCPTSRHAPSLYFASLNRKLTRVLSAPRGQWTMANIGSPPCDEAPILTGSCYRPAQPNGALIRAPPTLVSRLAPIE